MPVGPRIGNIQIFASLMGPELWLSGRKVPNRLWCATDRETLLK